MNKKWTVDVNGSNHAISFTLKQWSGKIKLFVDNEEIELEKTSFWFFDVV